MAVLGASVLAPVVAAAQPVPVVRVETSATDAGLASAPLHRVVDTIGPTALASRALAAQLRERYAAPTREGDPLATARERLRAARRAWSAGAAAGDEARRAQALAEIDRAAREIEAAGDARDTREDNRTALEQALIFLAERHDAAGDAVQSDAAMERLARVDSAITIAATAASPGVQQRYRRAVESLRHGALVVHSAPEGCTIVRDGRAVGTAPVELSDLAPGEHRISARCGALGSLVHRVDVVAQTRATVWIDAQLDAALTTDETPALHYASDEQGRARLAGDLAVLGRALGARRAVGVLVAQGRAVVVDVGTNTEVGTIATADDAGLRALLRQPVTTSVAPPPPARTTRPHDAPPGTTLVTRSTGLPASAVVLGVLGLAVAGAAGYAWLWADDARNRAERTVPRSEYEAIASDEALARGLSLGGFAAGGALLVTGVLVGLLARGHETVTVVRAAAAPLPGGAAGMVHLRF